MKAKFFCPACKKKVKAAVRKLPMTGSLSAYCQEGHPALLPEEEV